MPSAPTTSLDLTAPDVVADPYPFFAEERAAHPVARHEPSRHAGWPSTTPRSARCQRDRRMARIWRDREPAAYLEPFNLLHRNQMMENEPPEHTRLRRPVARAFARGHVERLRPRVGELAARAAGARSTRPASTSSASTPSRCRCWSSPSCSACRRRTSPTCGDWSQAIVKMYEVDPSPGGRRRRGVGRRRSSPGWSASWSGSAAPGRQDDLLSDLAATELSEDEMVAVGGAAAQRRPRGVGQRVRQRAGRRCCGAGCAPGAGPGGHASRRCCASTPRSSCSSGPRPRTSSARATWSVEAGQKVAVLLGAANRDPAVFERAGRVPGRPRRPTRTSPSGSGVHFCLGAPLARMELVESLAALWAAYPSLALAGEPESRGTFVLRGFRTVIVGGRIE